ncbi:hypothetical protein IWX65_003585, partial [Arthrobacter sp. CAN_A214]
MKESLRLNMLLIGQATAEMIPRPDLRRRGGGGGGGAPPPPPPPLYLKVKKGTHPAQGKECFRFNPPPPTEPGA